MTPRRSRLGMPRRPIGDRTSGRFHRRCCRRFRSCRTACPASSKTPRPRTTATTAVNPRHKSGLQVQQVVFVRHDVLGTENHRARSHEHRAERHDQDEADRAIDQRGVDPPADFVVGVRGDFPEFFRRRSARKHAPALFPSARTCRPDNRTPPRRSRPCTAWFRPTPNARRSSDIFAAASRDTTAAAARCRAAVAASPACRASASGRHRPPSTDTTNDLHAFQHRVARRGRQDQRRQQNAAPQTVVDAAVKQCRVPVTHDVRLPSTPE